MAHKHDGDDSFDMSKVPLYRKPTVQSRNLARASSRFPPILELPTFDLEESPEEEDSSRTVPGVTNNAQGTRTHIDITVTTPSRLTATHAHVNPAAEGSNAVVSPARAGRRSTYHSTDQVRAFHSRDPGNCIHKPWPPKQRHRRRSARLKRLFPTIHMQDACKTPAKRERTPPRLPRLSPARREAGLLLPLKGLGQQIWTTPTQEIVARCRANGMEYDKAG
ncbi:uncharacterized protein B0T15DRAFT_562377 [Chaetomium strumarium]|uniref:Uncharacterized protein n=1 Tax=Chaetomium strumarium TaxID=1170767 RepID=A0AAJ0GM74_9PEZI|nr:hypothetical protein B0T15DRAFT_562377 [Chaetomium strumarium]